MIFAKVGLGSEAVSCAGANDLGQIGDGTGAGNPVPQRITEFARNPPRTAVTRLSASTATPSSVWRKPGAGRGALAREPRTASLNTRPGMVTSTTSLANGSSASRSP